MSPAKKKICLTAALILPAIIAFLAFVPALQNGFINWDDPVYVYDNTLIRSLGPAFFKWAATAVVSSNWHPLTLVSHAIDYSIWGNDPFGHHLTNNVLHSLNTLLVALLAYRLYRAANIDEPKALIASFITALFFGVHPLRVESVAWVSERKDLLCALFYLLSVVTYLSYATSKKLSFYALSIVTFVLALLSKPMAVSLPIILLAIDHYPLQRLLPNLRRTLIEKAPFVILSALASLATLWAQGAGGAIRPLDAYPLGVRAFVAIRALALYLYKTFIPTGLAPYYPHPGAVDYFNAEYVASIALVTAISIVSVLLIKRVKCLLPAWIGYLAILLPVIGIVQVGGQASADRYTYIAAIIPVLLASLVISSLITKKSAVIRGAIVVVLLACFSALFFATVKYIPVWKDSLAFWSYELKRYPDTVVIAHVNRGMAYEDLGRFDEAISDYSGAIRISPGYPDFYVHRGRGYSAKGEYTSALSDFAKALSIKPDHKDALNNMGIAYLKMGEYALAQRSLKAALEIDPLLGAAYRNLAIVYERIGDIEKSLEASLRAGELGY